jgi:hypothetical protein
MKLFSNNHGHGNFLILKHRDDRLPKELAIHFLSLLVAFFVYVGCEV